MTTLSPGSGAVLLLLWIGSGVPDVFQLGELLVDLTDSDFLIRGQVIAKTFLFSFLLINSVPVVIFPH